MTLSTKSEALTEGVKVTVESRYMPQQSNPRAHRYAFSYHIRIENRGPRAVRLMSRHWHIHEQGGVKREVEGEGVIGQTPLLGRGEHFEYASGAVLATSRGSMHGSYHMYRDDGTQFDVQIAPFALEQPYSMN